MLVIQIFVGHIFLYGLQINLMTYKEEHNTVLILGKLPP